MLMVFYESDDHDAYLKSFSSAKAADAKYRALTETANAFALEDPRTRITTWTEQQELRVRYESREPLYPTSDERTGRNNAHGFLPSSQPRAERLDALRSSLKADWQSTARQVLTNLVIKVPPALATQVGLGLENVVAALQTQDSNVVAASVDLGVRRTIGAVVDATLDPPRTRNMGPSYD
jgi:hypothetical protein